MIQELSSFDDLSLEKVNSNSQISNTSFVSEYREIKHIGGGASAQVIEVEHIKTKEHYAVKRFDKYKFHDKKQANKIYLEIQLMKDFNHPNIITLFTTFEDGKYLNMVMQLAQMSLYDKLQQMGKLPEKIAVKYIVDIVNALEYLHNRQNPIIHRDIKPQNIVLKEDRCKLTDFGASNRIQSKGGTRDTFAGTVIYMPPQMENKVPYDQTIDLWCLGILIYELLTGFNPFLNMQEKDPDKIQFSDSFPVLARDVVKRLLRKDPYERMTLHQLKNHIWIRLLTLEPLRENQHIESKCSKVSLQIEKFKNKLNRRKEERKQIIVLKTELMEKTKEVYKEEYQRVFKPRTQLQLLEQLTELKITNRKNAEKLQQREYKAKKKQRKTKAQMEILNQEIEIYKSKIKQLKKLNIKNHRNIANLFQETINRMYEISKKIEQVPQKIKNQILFFRDCDVQDFQPKEYFVLPLIKFTNQLLKYQKSALQQRKVILNQLIDYQ